MPGAVLAGIALAALVVVALVVASTGARTDAATATTPTLVPPSLGALPADVVSFCHRTDSVINPYNLLTTDVDAVIRQGHGGHTGPIFPQIDRGQDDKWGDIIPPFDYDDGRQHYDGLNWPEGAGRPQRWLRRARDDRPAAARPDDNDCRGDHDSPGNDHDEANVVYLLTVDRYEHDNAGIRRDDNLGTVELVDNDNEAWPVNNNRRRRDDDHHHHGRRLGGATTTTTPSPGGTPPPTAAPPPLDPPPVEALAPGETLSDPPPHVLAFVLVPGNSLVRLGVLSPAQVRALFRELKARRLARTGTDTGALVPVALLSLAIGGALLALSARPRRKAA